VLFKRNLAVAVPNAKTHRRANWYMRLKIGGRKGYVTRSTKLTIYEDAYKYAKSELLRLQQAAKLGHSLDEHTFEQHWRDWFERNTKNGTWTANKSFAWLGWVRMQVICVFYASNGCNQVLMRWQCVRAN